MEQLDETRDLGAGTAASGELTDISGVAVEGTTAAERLESFLGQVSNPYYYKVGKTPVRISFAPGAAPLEDKLRAYFTALKQNAFGAQIAP